MMYSNRSEYSDRRSYGDRSSRHWDDRDDRREERRRSYREASQDSYPKYSGDRHSSTERKSSTEYSDSPKMGYGKDSVSKDWSRKSPMRRHKSSPDRGASERKRRRFTKDNEDDYRYRREPEVKTYRQSPDSFSHSNVSKDFRYRKSPQDSRYKHCHEDLAYRKQHDDYRPSSPYYKDKERRERSWDRSQESTRSSLDHSSRSYAKPRERNDIPSLQEDKIRFPLNGSYEQSFESDVTNQSHSVPEQKSTKGFQRFLDVLNKGVNVAMLTKIVTQTSTGAQIQEAHSLQRRDEEQSYFSSNSRSRSPSVVEKIPLTPEDEHKHRHMQDVLQAIGIDLGFEELGQMSHRIQERLYGKKDNDGSHHRRGSKGSDTRRTSSPRRRRSSSSRSNLSPSTQECFMTKDSYAAQRDVTEVRQFVEYGHDGSSSSLQDSEKCELTTQEGAAALEAPSPHPACSLSEAPLTPVMPTYSPVNRSLLPYPAMPPVIGLSLPPAIPPPLSSAMPPTLPHVVPGLFLPRLPPLLPYPHLSPLNILPAALGQRRALLPHPISHPQSPLLNLPTQPVHITQKSKPLSRPRCLQVIETKQPG